MMCLQESPYQPHPPLAISVGRVLWREVRGDIDHSLRYHIASSIASLWNYGKWKKPQWERNQQKTISMEDVFK
jgi:hypothetical protein